MAVGDKITVAEYNSIQANMVAIMGTKWGQTYSSTQIANSPISITNISGNGATVTVTFTTQTSVIPFVVGEKLLIAGASVTAYNGSWTVVGTPTLSQVQFTSTVTTTGSTGGTITPVPRVTSAQWTALRNDLHRGYKHITGIDGTLTDPTTATVITDADRAAYAAMAGYLNTNQYATPALTPSAQGAIVNLLGPSDGIRTSTWSGSVTHTATLTFASSAEAQYYFNSGGQIQLSATLTGIPAVGAPGYDKASDWVTLLSGVGTIKFDYTSTTQVGGNTNNVTISSSTGFYDLTPGAAATQIFNKSTTSPTYSGNVYTVSVALDSTSKILTFTMVFNDLSTGQTAHPGNPYAIDEAVSGTLTSSVNGLYSNNTLTVSVTRPTGSSSGP